MQDDVLTRAARAIRNLLAEHRDDFDARMSEHIETVATSDAEAKALQRGVNDAVAEHHRRGDS